MGLSTSVTAPLGTEHPVASAPMGGPVAGALAAAVPYGGGLGLFGGGRQPGEWLAAELAIVNEQTDKPRGVGSQSWALTMEVLEAALDHRP